MLKLYAGRIVLIGFFSFLLSACTTTLRPPLKDQQLGIFTVASTQNVTQLKYKSLDTIRYQVKGQSCIEVDPQTLAYIKGPQDNRIQRAVDAAIESGHDQGLKGDLMINVRIREKTVVLPPRRKDDSSLRRMECIIVSGELVELEP